MAHLCDFYPMLDDLKILARIISLWKSYPKERHEAVRSLDAILQDQAEGHGRLHSVDFISQLPDDVLVKILSLLPLKDAGATSILSPRWRFLWSSLTQLDFDGYKIPSKMANDHNLLVLERKKFVSQVYRVIECHNHPTVHVFRICSDLDKSNCNDIDYWLRFAQDKKVEKLDLDLWEYNNRDRNPAENYEFPLLSSDVNMIHLVEWPLSDPVVAEMKFLKEIFLSTVNISEPTLLGLLKSAPRLETLKISGSCMLTHIHVGGRNLNLKHFDLADCDEVKSISLYDFDLVTFIYEGPEINLRLTGLPMLKKFEFCEYGVGLKNSVLNQISTVASNLHVLYLDIHCPEVNYNVNSIPKLPNVKKLVLQIGAEEDDSLLEFTSIAKACPRLEKFKIVLMWSSPIKRRKKVKHAAPHPHEHLKIFKIEGYYGRISDLELAVYAIDNAVALKLIVIDPFTFCIGNLTVEERSKRTKAARSSAERQLRPIVPQGLKLVIL